MKLKSKKKSHPFFNRLSYSFGNEDWLTELEALNLKPEDDVLAITASGDRPLHLLLHPCKRLVAIDANPVQNHLLSLKMTALQHLDHEDYISFLGLKESAYRLIMFDKKLLPFLPDESATYWLKNRKKLSQGVLYQGALEKWAKKGAFLLRLLKKKEIDSLFEQQTLNEQREFLNTRWAHRLWKGAINFFINPKLSRLFFKDPGICINKEAQLNPGHYVYERMIEHLQSNLANSNFFMQLIFLGKISIDTSPPYLQEKNNGVIKENLSKIQIETHDLIEYLENSPSNSFDKFSLSDVASYLNYDQYVRLLKAVRHAAKPGARFCIRQFMSRYQIPVELNSCFKPEPEFAKILEKKDRTFIYHFTVGTIHK